uniref:Uncharacterized protein n=1 Tax=Meloidogyne enterolobii TaxID=390850 RepID=A0A6V7VDW1_MELEN|nr:unnamed protein product [Meloidogyne enterolobii]CAD2180823.1 unnamed protein product [Meloidogyne enterolobii]
MFLQFKIQLELKEGITNKNYISYIIYYFLSYFLSCFIPIVILLSMCKWFPPSLTFF